MSDVGFDSDNVGGGHLQATRLLHGWQLKAAMII